MFQMTYDVTFARVVRTTKKPFLLTEIKFYKMPSIALASDDKSLAGMFSWTYTRIPPPNLSRSKRKGVQNPGILNWPSGNDSSIFVSDRTKTSTLPETCSTRASNLFLKEFMFRQKEIYLLFEISNNLKYLKYQTIWVSTPWLTNY